MARFRQAGVCLLLLATACGGGAQAGVNVKSVASDLVYGVPKKVLPAAPANLGTPPAEPVQVIIQGGNLNSRQGNDFPLPPAPECPKAPADRFPKKAAKSAIEGRPEAGRYLWRVDGTQETTHFGRIKIARSTPRVIQNVVSSTGNDFQYTTVERDLTYGSREIITTTYAVKSDGIYLTQIKREAGNASGVFQPTPAINIFPLPATIGNKIDSTGIDPTTLEALRVTGTVPKRFRIDACGEPLDSFYVDGTESFISAGGTSNTRNYNYGVATQLGGVIIFEHVDAPCTPDSKDKCSPAPTITFDAHLGQVKPSPVR